jgi:hypothetical protein
MGRSGCNRRSQIWMGRRAAGGYHAASLAPQPIIPSSASGFGGSLNWSLSRLSLFASDFTAAEGGQSRHAILIAVWNQLLRTAWWSKVDSNCRSRGFSSKSRVLCQFRFLRRRWPALTEKNGTDRKWPLRLNRPAVRIHSAPPCSPSCSALFGGSLEIRALRPTEA